MYPSLWSHISSGGYHRHDRGTPCPQTGVSPAQGNRWTLHATDGTPLTVTHEDFLVYHCGTLPEGAAEFTLLAEGDVRALPEGAAEFTLLTEGDVRALPEGAAEFTLLAEGDVRALPEGAVEFTLLAEGDVRALPEGAAEFLVVHGRAVFLLAPHGGDLVRLDDAEDSLGTVLPLDQPRIAICVVQ